MTSVICTCVLAGFLLVSAANFLEEDRGTVTAIDGPAVEDGQPEVNPAADVIANIQCPLGMKADWRGKCTTLPDDDSNSTTPGVNPGCQKIGGTSQPIDGPKPDEGQPVSNDTMQNVPSSQEQLKLNDTPKLVLPCQNISQSIIRVAQWPCPEGQKRDWKGNCRQVV